MNTSLKRWIQALAPLAILAVIALVFRDQLPFLGQAWEALRGARTAPVMAAIGASLLSIAAMAVVMQLLINVQGRVTSVFKSTAITLASNAWSTTIPGGPAFSAWLTFRVQRAWGASAGVCGWFFLISGALSTVWLVVIGIAAVIFLGANLSATALIASLVLAVSTTVALLWATRHPLKLKRWVRFLPARIHDAATHTIEQVARIRMSSATFATTALFSLLNRVFDLAALYFAVWSVSASAPGLTAGLNQTTITGVALAFIMTKLAGAAQITPGGVGTVEPIATAALVASGMTLIDATAATLIYRAISFALISLIGWIIYLAAYAGRGYMLGRPVA